MMHKILITALFAFGLSLSGASLAAPQMVTKPDGSQVLANVEGNTLKLQAGKLWVPAGDGTYKTGDGKTIIVQGGIIMAQSGSSSPPKTAAPPPAIGLKPLTVPAPMQFPSNTAAPPPAIGLKPLTAPAPTQFPSKTAAPSPPSVTSPVLPSGIAGAAPSGPAVPALNIPVTKGLTQLSPTMTRQIMLSRTQFFTDLKNEVERKRAKAEADAARPKAQIAKAAAAAALAERKARQAILDASTPCSRSVPCRPGVECGHDGFCRCNTDADGDGFVSVACGGNDCDDNDAGRHPGNVEVCDAAGKDEDCDEATYGVMDRDGDGHIDTACFNTTASGVVIGGRDCDDTRANIYPYATEICDLYDNNCDGFVDEFATLPKFLDADGDGRGSAAHRLSLCPREIEEYATRALAGGPWLSDTGNDCDDNNPLVWTGCR